MKLGVALSVAAAAIVLESATAEGCAACRNPSLPSAQSGGAPVQEGELRTDVTTTGTTVHVIHTAGCEDTDDCDEVPAQPLYLHDQRMTPLELRLGAEYGLSPVFGVALELPVRAVISRIRFTTPEGEPYQPLDPDVHHRNETVWGVADALALARAGSLFGGTWFSLRAGVSLPLAHTEEDPFELGDQGIRHQHVQLGSGTFEPLLGVDVFRRFDSFSLQGFALAQMSLYENHHGYRAPLRVQGGADGSLDLVSTLSGSLGAGVYYEGPERWQGVIRQDGSLGRTELYASAGLSYALDKTVLRGNVRVPFYRNIVAGDEPLGEYSSPLIVSVGVSHTFEP